MVVSSRNRPGLPIENMLFDKHVFPINTVFGAAPVVFGNAGREATDVESMLDQS